MISSLFISLSLYPYQFILIHLSLLFCSYSFILALLSLFLYPCAFVLIPLSLRFCLYSFVLALLSLFLYPCAFVFFQISLLLCPYFLIRKSSVPYSTTWPSVTQISEMVPSSSEAISFISFIASTIQRVWPFFTLSPIET